MLKSLKSLWTWFVTLDEDKPTKSISWGTESCDLDGYDDSHEISAAMGHQGGMAIRQNREDPYR